MPDTNVIDPPKPSFQQIMAASRPKDAAELKAMEAGTAPQPSQSPPPKPDPAPSKPAESKSVSPPPADDLEARDQKLAAENKDFKRVKHAATEANRRADELKAQHEAATKELAELRKNRGDADRVSKLEKERDELKSKWQAVAAQFDSGFHAKYETKVGEAIAKIKDAVPADRLAGLTEVLQWAEGERKRKALAELTEDMDAPTVTDIMLANREVREILAARKKELDDSGTVLKTSAEQRKKEQDERKAAYEKSFDTVLKSRSAGDDAIPVLQAREGDSAEVKEWNAGVAERTAVARAVFMDEFDTPEEKAEASIWAASAPGFLKELKAAQAENAQLKETLAKLQSASPGLGSGGKGSGDNAKMTFQERMAQAAI